MNKRNVKKKGKRRHVRSRSHRKWVWLRISAVIVGTLLLFVAVVLVSFGWMQHKNQKTEPDVGEIEPVLSEDESNPAVALEDDSAVQSVEDAPIETEKRDELWAAAITGLGEQIRNQIEMITEYQEESEITISIMGDSISTYQEYIPAGYYDFFPDNGAVKDVNETWWKPVIDNLGLKLYTNASSSGATCIGDSASQDNPQYGCDDFRISALAGPDGKSPDIIIVYMGTNDLLESVPLGDNNGLREVPEGIVSNFSDAYTLILDKLRKTYPDSHIYCCTIAQIGTWGTDTVFVEFVNGVGEGLRASDYNACIRQIAENKAVSVIDLYNCGITLDNLQDTTADGIHPTPLGMSYIANTVKAGLESSISN